MGGLRSVSKKRAFPAAVHLIAYCLAIALPLIAVLSVLLMRNASDEEERVRQRMLTTLLRTIDSLDRDLDRHLAILQTLATSPALKNNNWPVFYDHAKAALEGRSYVVLVDTTGRQIVNTFVPFGQAPAVTGDPETIKRMAKSPEPIFSNLFQSLVVKRPVLNVSVPILDGGELRYVLSLALFPETLASLLDQQNIGISWATLIWDARNVVLAHWPAGGKHNGKPLPEQMPSVDEFQITPISDLDGKDVQFAWGRSALSGWGVGIQVPGDFFGAQNRVTRWLTVITFAAILLAVGLGVLIAREFTNPLAAASKAALGLVKGEPFRVKESRLKEANDFADALQLAQTELTQRRNSEQLLVRELQHRTNNLLAVVQALAHKSLSGKTSVAEAKESFEARLQALARIHRELVSNNWSGVSLDNIVRLTLEPYAARINIGGAAVTLDAQQAQNMSLAVHELATNAVKYGALANSQGTIHVTWSTEREVLNFRWEEAGGPAVVPPTRRGFGTLLLRATFSEIKLDYPETGFSCEIRMPVEPGSAGVEKHKSADLRQDETISG